MANLQYFYNSKELAIMGFVLKKKNFSPKNWLNQEKI